MKRLGLGLLAGLALASCGESAEVVEEDNEDATARGEVLGGTITDDMLPLDTVTSQAPSRATPGAADGETASSEPETGADGGEQAPTPAAAPAPETAPEPPAPAGDDEPAE